MAEEKEPTAGEIMRDFRADLKRSAVLSKDFIDNVMITMGYVAQRAREDAIQEGIQRGIAQERERQKAKNDKQRGDS